jgi:predicted amidophosphoribosyltransferase
VTAFRVASEAWLLELVFPSRCVSCGAPAEVVCGRCRPALRPVGPPWCARCGAPTIWPVERCRECGGRRLAFRSARAATVYAGPARAVVRAWKEHGLRRAAPWAAELVALRVERPAADVIAYIPPDPSRALRRGRHPAEQLAVELGRRWRLPVEPLLVRTHRFAGSRQAALSRGARLTNVRGAFVARRGCAGRRVALVDDVYTTGATAAAASSALRRAGADSVEVVTFARTVRT